MLYQPGGFGPGVGLAPVTLHIDEACVWVEHERSGHATTLVWEGDKVGGRPKNRRIVFIDRRGWSVRLADGARIEAGGVSLWSSDVPDGQDRATSMPELGRRWEVSLDEAWLHEPDPSCPEPLLYLDEVTVTQ